GERIAGDSRFRRRAFTRPEAAIGHEIDRMAWEPAGEALAVYLHGFGVSAEIDQRLRLSRVDDPAAQRDALAYQRKIRLGGFHPCVLGAIHQLTLADIHQAASPQVHQ